MLGTLFTYAGQDIEIIIFQISDGCPQVVDSLGVTCDVLKFAGNPAVLDKRNDGTQAEYYGNGNQRDNQSGTH